VIAVVVAGIVLELKLVDRGLSLVLVDRDSSTGMYELLFRTQLRLGLRATTRGTATMPCLPACPI